MKPTASFLFGCAALVAVSAQPALAQDYPNRTIKMIVGYGAGGGTDVVARLVAQKMAETFGQSVVVENRAGGNGMLGPEIASKAAPDGYTLLFGASGQMAISPAIYAKVPYDTLKDFIPVSMMSSYPVIMVVNTKHPAKTVKDFVAWSKANPDKTNFGSSSAAFTMASELFKLKTGTPGQFIPFKSSNDSVMAVIGDQTTYAIAEPPPIVPQVSAGNARAIAVAAPQRLPELPDVPTMKEAGVDMSVALWLGVLVPKGTPAAIVKKLEAECQRIAQLPDFKEKLRAMSTDSIGGTSEQFVAAIADEIKMWSEVKKAANLAFEQ